MHRRTSATRLPVVDTGQRLVGLISRPDIVKAMREKAFGSDVDSIALMPLFIRTG
ncbi:MAG: CBS domain-containing protein [Thermodesulfovibrionales bacterium]